MLAAAIAVICSAALLSVPLAVNEESEDDIFITDLKAESIDGAIRVSWVNPKNNQYSGIELTFTSELEHYTQILSNNCESYTFESGTHGVYYQIVAIPQLKSGINADPVSVSAMFLDFGQLPASVPLITVETTSGREPTADYVSAPEGAVGSTTENKLYENATISVRENNKTKNTVSGKIKIRGNTSAYYDKKPYKLKLNDALSLLDDGESHKEYLLLAERKLNTAIGHEISGYMTNSWQSNYKYVNLIINGDWKGLYLLVEPVANAISACNITSSGFMLESDPYWWSDQDPELQFQTAHQDNQFKYTLKYPAQTDTGWMNSVESYMNRVDELLYAGNESYAEYLDLDSFSSWLLAHDILGTNDSSGSNMYVYMTEFNAGNLQGTSLRMGPLWDFDAAFECDLWTWENIHYVDNVMTKQLLTQSNFRTAYSNTWDEKKDGLYPFIQSTLQNIYTAIGDGLNQSRKLDAVRWSRDGYSTIEDEIDDLDEWFSSRIDWMDEQIRIGNF